MGLDFNRILPYFDFFWIGLGNTIKITVISLVGAFLISLIIVLLRISKIKILNWIAMFYVSLFRGIPLLVQLFIAYFAISEVTNNTISMSAMNAGIVTFTLYSAAYLSENIRGGILSVDKGQTEAAMALGIKEGIILWNIILPQAMRISLPSIINTAIVLLKNTSIISQIGVMDLMRSGQHILTKTYLAFEPLAIVAVFYLILVIALTIISNKIENKLNKSSFIQKKSLKT